MRSASPRTGTIFLSTPSARRATIAQKHPDAAQTISIHALREEGDLFGHGGRLFRQIFLSTPSARRATPPYTQQSSRLDISIHALREEGDTTPSCQQNCSVTISIHALREEGDRQAVHFQSDSDGISIHALREEGDALLFLRPASVDAFLSTPSARRATGAEIPATRS